MFKNVASKIALFAFDTTTNAPKTGDAANLTAYVSKDYGSVTVLTDTSATEMDSTNAKGWYLFDLAQAETNADSLIFSGKSTTSNISVVGKEIFTTPNRFSTMVIDAAGLADATTVKLGPSGSATAQTARDVGGSVLLSSGTGAGQISLSSGTVTVGTNSDKTGYRLSSTGVDDILRTSLTEGYASDGSTFTLEQALYMLWSALTEFSISGTTITAKKLDGSTTSFTFTLDSSTSPTSRTRAT